MRGVPLWGKINIVILLAFGVAAAVASSGLHHFMEGRLACAGERTQALLTAVAAPAVREIVPLLETRRTDGAVQAVVTRLAGLKGVSDVALFDPDGRLMAQAGPSAGEPLGPDNTAKPAADGDFSLRSDHGRLVGVLRQPVTGPRGTLGVLRLRSSLKSFGDAHRRLWLLFSLGLLAAYVLTAVLLQGCLQRLVLHPLNTLRRALEDVGRGRLDQRLPVVSRDDLGRTAAAFNAMASRLRRTAHSLNAARTEVEEQRRLLELRVETRTAELAETNARLMTEVAGRRRAEEERERLLALHRVILESRAEAVVCAAAGDRHRVLAVNRRFLELWRLPDDWSDRAGEERLDLVFRQVTDVGEGKRDFTALMHDAETISEDVLALRDGRFFERRSGPIRQGRAFLGRVFSYVDVTDRRRDEARLRQALAQRDALLGNSPVGLATLQGHLCLDINRRGAEILGYEREELIGRHSRVVFADEATYQSASQAFAARRAEADSISVERQVRRRDGSLIWVRAQAKVVRGGPLWEVVWAFDDITPEMERQAKLEQARREAEEASRAKGAFLAVMSHEIRTPLNVIMGLTELLLGQNVDEEQVGYLGTIKDSVSHLIGIINDILDFSKIEAGKLVLERVDFDVPALVNAVARGLEIQAGRKGLDFTVTVAADVPATLRGDPGRLRQVLVNLIGNAVKFTDAGGVILDVKRVDPLATPAGTVGLSVRVADTGIGIPAERLPELFASFQQGSDAIARRFGGTGLGLAISKEIVERMGGHIEASSTEGQGSVFSCVVFMEPGDPAKVSALPETAEPAPLVPGQPLRVLLVEDNALNARVTRLHLTRQGHDLTLTASARAAYAKLAEARYDVVLMDVEMPEIDGITATRTIRAGGPDGAPVLDPRVPIVAVTAHAVEDIRQQCLDAGMDGFVTKPINYHTLALALRRLDRGHPADVASPPTPQAPAPAASSGSALFDPEGARAAMGILWKDYAALTRVSYGEGQDRLGDVRAALTAGDVARAAIAAHTFKGIAATMGAYSCRDLGVDLEKALRADKIREAGELLDRLVPLWQAVGQALDAWQAPSDAPR